MDKFYVTTLPVYTIGVIVGILMATNNTKLFLLSAVVGSVLITIYDNLFISKYRRKR